MERNGKIREEQKHLFEFGLRIRKDV